MALEKLILTDRERIMLRALIMTRQAGNVSGSVSFYMRTEHDNATKKKALLDHLMCDLGDLILQAEMLATDLGIDKITMKQLAKERYEECKNEFATSGKSQYFI